MENSLKIKQDYFPEEGVGCRREGVRVTAPGSRLRGRHARTETRGRVSSAGSSIKNTTGGGGVLKCLSVPTEHDPALAPSVACTAGLSLWTTPYQPEHRPPEPPPGRCPPGLPRGPPQSRDSNTPMGNRWAGARPMAPLSPARWEKLGSRVDRKRKLRVEGSGAPVCPWLPADSSTRDTKARFV